MIDEYKKKVNEGANTNNINDNYYQLAKDQEYSALWDKEVQLENAKANALKYTNNNINAQGFGGTGYGSSIQSGIYGNYLNKVGQAQTDYSNTVRDINLQEAEANKAETDDRFKSITTMITQASDMGNLNDMLVNYGYGTVDGDNNFVWGEKPEGMSDDDWYQMQYYYGMQKSALSEDMNLKNVANSLDALNNLTYIDPDSGTVRSLVDGFSEEVKTMWHYVTNGQYKDGDVIALESKGRGTQYIMYTNKGVKIVSEEEYNNAKGKKYLIKNSGSGDKQNITQTTV